MKTWVWVSSIHVKMWTQQWVAIIPVRGRQKQVDPWNLLAKKPSQIHELWVQEKSLSKYKLNSWGRHSVSTPWAIQNYSQVWLYIQHLGRLGKKGPEFKDSLGYVMSSCLKTKWARQWWHMTDIERVEFQDSQAYTGKPILNTTPSPKKWNKIVKMMTPVRKWISFEWNSWVAGMSMSSSTTSLLDSCGMLAVY